MSAPTPEIKKTTQLLRCILTPDETIAAGKELAEATSELKELEEEKSNIVANFKAKSTEKEARITVLTNKIRSGYEYRNVECETRYDTPEEGRKQTIRLDSNTITATEPMTEEEKQRNLPLEETDDKA